MIECLRATLLVIINNTQTITEAIQTFLTYISLCMINCKCTENKQIYTGYTEKQYYAKQSMNGRGGEMLGFSTFE